MFSFLILFVYYLGGENQEPPATVIVLNGGRTALPREFGVIGGHLGCHSGWWPVGGAEAGQGGALDMLQ